MTAQAEVAVNRRPRYLSVLLLSRRLPPSQRSRLGRSGTPSTGVNRSNVAPVFTLVYAAKAAMAFHSSGLNLSFAAATFSSKCFKDDVPGIGNITGDRCNNQANATWTT